MAIVILRPVTSYFIVILFLPSIISSLTLNIEHNDLCLSVLGTIVFFTSARPNLNKTNRSLTIVILSMMIFSCAQVFCGLFLVLYVFVDGEYGRDNEILNRDVFVGASVILCMTHILVSLSLFTKFSILLWSTQQQ